MHEKILMNGQSEIMLQTVFMPDGSPAPFVLTQDEAIRFLRLENVKHPEHTLRYYSEKGLLQGTYIGKCRFYILTELVKFTERVTRSERTVQNGESRNLRQ